MQKKIWILGFIAVSGLSLAMTNQSTSTTTTTTEPSTTLNTQTQTIQVKPGSGDTKVSIPSISVINANGPSIDASGIEWESEYDIKSSTTNHVGMNLVIKNLKITNAKYPIDGSFSMVANMDNVNYDMMLKISDILRSVQNAKGTDRDNKQLQQQAMEEINHLLPYVVTNSTTVTMREIFTTQHGDFMKDLKFSYPPDAPLPQTTEALLKNMRLSLFLKLSIPMFDNLVTQVISATQNSMPAKPSTSSGEQKPLDPAAMQAMVATMVTQFIDSSVKNGYIVKTPTDYTFTLNYENGVLRINGKTMSELSPSKAKPSKLMETPPPTTPPSSIMPSSESMPTTTSTPITPEDDDNDADAT